MECKLKSKPNGAQVRITGDRKAKDKLIVETCKANGKYEIKGQRIHGTGDGITGVKHYSIGIVEWF